jgi:hypothetical protein
MTRRLTGAVLVSVTALAFLTLSGRRADAYLHFGVGTTSTIPRDWKWPSFPIRYYVGTRPLPNLSAAEFQAVIQGGFDRWRQASGAPISATFAGFVTGIEPPVRDDLNVIAIQDLPAGVLGVTYVRVNGAGELGDIDMGITAAQPWSTNPAGETGRFDLPATVTHELGHLLGMAHSMLGETTALAGGGRRVAASETIMFPIAFSPGSAARPLGTDDVAGISDLYPPNGFRQQTGTITGRVRKDGRGVFGAHVVAFDPATKALVAAFSLSAEGDFTIAGLAPGPKVVRVEPLDDAGIGSFFGSTVAPVDNAFAVTYAPQIVLVAAGQSVGPVTIEVKR